MLRVASPSAKVSATSVIRRSPACHESCAADAPVACTAYAVVRYHIFGRVPWQDFPLFIANKGISYASVCLIAASYVVHRRWLADSVTLEDRRMLARRAGLGGVAFAVVHVVISFEIFDPSRYPSLFSSEGLSASGWVCLWSGALASGLFGLPAVYSFPCLLPTLGAAHWGRAQQFGYWALGLTALHALSIGSANWTTPARWPGGLPPISLLSFIVCVAPIAAKIFAVARRGPARVSNPVNTAST